VIRTLGNKQWLPGSLRQTFLCPTLLIQFQVAVHAVHPFVVLGKSSPFQNLVCLPETVTRMLGDHRIDRIDYFLIIASFDNPIKGRSGDSNARTRSLHR